jgi:trk system potassium uptake protein TrkA
MPQRAIIVGGGPVGSRVAAILGEYGHDPVVIERNADRCEQLRDSRHGLIVHGDGTDPAVVEQTDPERADTFAALTGSPGTNRALCRRVKTRVGTIRTVARGKPSDDSGSLVDAVDGTVNPTVAGAKAVAGAMLGYDQRVCGVPTSGFDLVEFAVDPRAPAANRELRTVTFPSGSHVVADTGEMQVAGPGTELRPDSQYLLAVEPTAADAVRNLLQGVR